MKNVPTLIIPHFGVPQKWIQLENFPNGEIVAIIVKQSTVILLVVPEVWKTLVPAYQELNAHGVWNY